MVNCSRVLGKTGAIDAMWLGLLKASQVDSSYLVHPASTNRYVPLGRRGQFTMFPSAPRNSH